VARITTFLDFQLTLALIVLFLAAATAAVAALDKRAPVPAEKFPRHPNLLRGDQSVEKVALEAAAGEFFLFGAACAAVGGTRGGFIIVNELSEWAESSAGAE